MRIKPLMAHLIVTDLRFDDVTRAHSLNRRYYTLEISL